MKNFIALSLLLGAAVSINAQSSRIQQWPAQDLTNGFNNGAPVGLASQGIIYFVSPLFDEKAGNPMDKIAYATRNINGTWSELMYLKSPLNDDFNNTVVGVDSTGMNLYLLGRYKNNPRARVGLSMSTLVGGYWSDPQKVKLKGLNPFTEYYSLFVTPDEKLVFATFERSFKRRDDIYYAVRNSTAEKFSKLKRLPIPVNTVSSEISPFYDGSTSTLYFAREVGEGDSANYDLYFSKALSNDFSSWSEPEPMKDLNSPGFEAYYWRGMEGFSFFTSDQFNFGKSDILMFDERAGVDLMATKAAPAEGLGNAFAVRDAIEERDLEPKAENFSMVKILDRDEMLIDLASSDDEVPAFELNAILKDTNGKTLPEGVVFNVKNGAGSVLRSEVTDENGAIKVTDIPVQDDLQFEIADEAYQNVQMEVLNKKGEVTASANMDEMKEFIFEKLEAEQAAIALIKNMEDPRMPKDMINKFLAGESEALSLDRELANTQGLVPVISDETQVVMSIKGLKQVPELDRIDFIDDNGNVVKTLYPIDNMLSYQEVEDIKCSFVRINGGSLLDLDNQVSYLRSEDMYKIICSPIADPNMLADIESKVLAREIEAKSAIASADAANQKDSDNESLIVAGAHNQSSQQSLQNNNSKKPGNPDNAVGKTNSSEVINADQALASQQSAKNQGDDETQLMANGVSSDNLSGSKSEETASADKKGNNAAVDGQPNSQETSAGALAASQKASKMTGAGGSNGSNATVDFHYEIYFGFDKSTLDERAKLQLDRLSAGGALMPSLIEGSADTVGPLAYNQLLSERRANAVAEALNMTGATAVKGVGEQAGIAPAQARKVSVGIAVNPSALGSEASSAQTSSMIVYHRLEEAQPESQYMPLLNEVADYLVANPQVGLRIQSHTDHRGSSDYNVSLSMRRAQHVQSFMKGKGVNQNQLKATWFGETQLASGCQDGAACDNVQKSKDRRTELSFYNLK